jgi:hypothetical protein
MKYMKNIRIIPVISYQNSNILKTNILEDNRNKSGIYLWTNLITNKRYVGSSVDLYNRLRTYFSYLTMKNIVKKESSYIYRAILKLGHSNFSLDIIEYCEPHLLIEKEQYYINILNPEYNILKVAGSRSGHKLSEKSRETISLALRNRKINSNISNINHNDTKFKISHHPKSIKIKIYDLSNNFIKEFNSIANAARYFNIVPSTIRKILKRENSFYGYIFKSEFKYDKIKVHNLTNKIGMYNKNYELIEILDNPHKISIVHNIPTTTVYRYIKTGKIYKNKFYFKKINDN